MYLNKQQVLIKNIVTYPLYLFCKVIHIFHKLIYKKRFKFKTELFFIKSKSTPQMG